jgi:hypothetical protein
MHDEVGELHLTSAGRFGKCPFSDLQPQRSRFECERGERSAENDAWRADHPNGCWNNKCRQTASNECRDFDPLLVRVALKDNRRQRTAVHKAGRSRDFG